MSYIERAARLLCEQYGRNPKELTGAGYGQTWLSKAEDELKELDTKLWCLREAENTK